MNHFHDEVFVSRFNFGEHEFVNYPKHYERLEDFPMHQSQEQLLAENQQLWHNPKLLQENFHRIIEEHSCMIHHLEQQQFQPNPIPPFLGIKSTA